MAKSQQTFNKKEKEKKRLKKQQDKKIKADERKANSAGGSLENMIAYVDEFGNISETPPDPTVKKEKIKAENIEIGIPRREHVDEGPEKKGRVDFFNDQKGFGFIKDDANQMKYFVHANGLIDDIQEGDKVSFELERGMKGMNAVNVKKI